MNSQEFAAMNFTSVGFTGKWLTLIGDPSERWNMMIWSRPGKGKSTLMIEFAKYLAATFSKRVLYVAKEEGFGATLKDKFTRMDAIDPLITISDTMPAGFSGYDYVFLDSVSALKLSTEDLSQLIGKNPRVNFVFICQTNGDGNYRGEKDQEHLVDVSIEITDDSVAQARKSRFGGKAKVNIFSSSKVQESGQKRKFSNIHLAQQYKSEHPGYKIVFGTDNMIWCCPPDMAESYALQGLDTLP